VVMVKTAIEVDEDVWRRFSLIVLREKGVRRKNEVIVAREIPSPELARP